jgi:hypothetical protein
MAWSRAREIPMFLAAFFTAIILIDAFLVVPDVFSDFVSDMQRYTIIMQSTALGLAFLTLLLHHGREIQRRTPGQWYYSAWLIFMMLVMTISGLMPPITKHWVYDWLYSNVYVPSRIALYGIMACFIASATYRAFRARTIDGAACLIAAGLVLIGMNTPLGDMVSPAIAKLAEWFVVVPQMGGGRALIFLTAVGMMGLTLRLITGKIREVV